ncbi:MAG: Sel1 repeat-containing protein [bacterium]|nr:MAG: Sel1 repeat-containing protein [bacterium]
MFEAAGLVLTLALAPLPPLVGLVGGQDPGTTVTAGCGDVAFETRYAEARRWCTAAAAGDADAQSWLGMMYLSGQGLPQDDFEALRWFRLAAAQGDLDGIVGIADLHRRGQSVERDEAEADRLYRLAAEQGHAGSQAIVGGKYEMGFGVPQDYVEAARWYRLAAEQGHIGAQAGLAIFYENGTGVERDEVEAYKWFLIAASIGGYMLAGLPDEIAAKLTPEQLAEGRRRAAAWQRSPRMPVNQ